MSVTHAHSFLVSPSKSAAEPPDVRGVSVPLRGQLFEMLTTLLDEAHLECDIDVVFRPRDNKVQENDCRDLFLAYLRAPGVNTGEPIAKRLQSVTTKRSGLGLLFLLRGKDHNGQRLVVARFPADSGVLAEDTGGGLQVEFVERVFMKSSKAFKSVMYVTPDIRTGFWEGKAVDKQINNERELSDYWIKDFLLSDLRTTGAAGTKRLAVAIRHAIAQSKDDSVRNELLAASQMIRNQQGRLINPSRLAHTLNLSSEAVEGIRAGMPRAELFTTPFRFDRDEYDRHVTYRSVTLDNGAVLTAENADFGVVFQRDVVDAKDNVVRFSTEGKVVDEKLRKKSP